MRKICLTVVGLFVMMLHAFSQYRAKDTTVYESKPLKVDEINIVSSYYNQDGNHSAVTGGIGTEKVSDLSNTIEVKWVGWDGMNRKNTLTAGLGIDHHTSASSAFVNKSGASKTGGTRVYPSLNWNIENEQKGTGFGLGAYYSSEYNYKSFGLDAEFSKKTKSNGELQARVTGYFDKVKLIYPSELIPTTTTSTNTSASRGGDDGSSGIPSSPRYTYTGSLSFSQVINKRLQASVMADVVFQNGYLGLPFHRVYFNDGTVHVENLPVNRFKIPLGVRINYFLGDNIVIRSYYRYYQDDWGLTAHTASLEVPVKISPFFSISPFYRYYVQTAAKYFQPYEMHTTKDEYYTSNYAYSAFTSQFFGAGLRIAPPNGVFGTHLNTLEIRYGHYTQTTSLMSDVISVNLKFK